MAYNYDKFIAKTLTFTLGVIVGAVLVFITQMDYMEQTEEVYSQIEEQKSKIDSLKEINTKINEELTRERKRKQ